MTGRHARRLTPTAILVLLAAVFVTAVVHDLRGMAADLDSHRRMMACLGIFQLKGSLGDEDPAAICRRVIAEPDDADHD